MATRNYAITADQQLKQMTVKDHLLDQVKTRFFYPIILEERPKYQKQIRQDCLDQTMSECYDQGFMMGLIQGRMKK